MYQPGDIVLQFSPQLKLGEANKFHCLWEGLFEIVERVSEVTFRIQSRGRHSWCSSVGPFNNLRLYKRAASVDSQGDKPADSDLKNVDVLGDASGLTSVLCGEQNVYEAKQPSLPASVGDHQETVVMQDEFPLPAEDCVNKRLESLPSPSKELKNPVILLPPPSSFDDSDLPPSRRPHPCLVQREPDHYGDWVINSVNSNRLLEELVSC